MAEKKRKSTRKFNLEKPVERHFDIEKDGITIAGPETVSKPLDAKAPQGNHQESKVPQEKGPVNSNQLNQDESQNEPSGNGYKKWIAATAAGLLVAGGLAYFVAGNNNDTPAITDTIADTSSLTENSDSASAKKGTDTVKVLNSAENSISSSVTPDNVGSVEEANVQQQESSTSSVKDSQEFDDKSSKMTSSPAKNPSPVRNTPATVDKTPVSTTQTGGTGTIEEEAIRVLQGAYGNNPERRRLLGSNYKAIQKRVNEMYRKRQFR